MTLIIGSEGSMGKRYQAILSFLGKPFECYDMKFGGYPQLDKYSHFIIATPTETHFRWVQNLDQYQKPILCEKPLSKDMDEVRGILACTAPLSLMMQYHAFDIPTSHGLSWYNYYAHGKDGLAWDCFQIIALARGEFEIKETSPVWSAGINGHEIERGHMDTAYLYAVINFYDGKYFSKDQMLEWHWKVDKYAKSI